MPHRQTYQVNNREQGKAAQRDQSYRSCLITLLIFFFMCIILILACIPWKTRSQREYKNENTGYEHQFQQDHHKEHTKEAVTPRTTVLLTTLTTPTTTSTISTTTVKNISIDQQIIDIFINYNSRENAEGSSGSGTFERYSENEMTEDETITSSAVTLEENTKGYIMMTTEVTQYTEQDNYVTERGNFGTSRHDTVTDNVIDNNAASPSEPEYNVTTTEIINLVTTSNFIEETTTDNYSSDTYHNSEKSEFDNEADNITNSILSTMSVDLNENTTSEYKTSETDVLTNDIYSTTSSSLIDLEESSSVEYSTDKHYSERSQTYIATNNITSSTLSSIRSDLEEDRNTKNSTSSYLNNEESTTSGYNALTLPLIEKLSTTTDITNEAKNIMGVTASIRNQSEPTENYNMDMTSVTTEKHHVSSTNDYANAATTTDIPLSHENTNLMTTTRTLFSEDINICETGHCKQIASKMLSYMNHSVDPCDDFYEYACGGFEADPQLIDGDFVRRSRNYQRIARQMAKEKRENVHSTFATYYDSCVQYERTMNFSERAKMAYDALGKVGKFYINATWSNNYTDFTDLLAKLMLRHNALLFDIVPELDEYRPNNFTLKIGPSMYESPFKTEYLEDSCFEDEFEMKGQYVDLVNLYDNYQRCKNNTKEFMRSIKEALTELRVFKGSNDSHVERGIEAGHIERTIHVINSAIMQGYFSHFPSRSEIREAYLMNNYSRINLEELQSSSMFVNWTQLIHSLTETNVNQSEYLQVYFHMAMVKGLCRLEEFARENPMDLNNAIMALYAHKLYRELVLSRRDNVKDHCLHVAIYLLRLEASSLYISSFSKEEIMQMNRVTERTFKELKQTLKLKTEGAQWAREEGRQGLLKKINSLELALPVVSYFKNRDLLYSEYNVSQIILHDNYFHNSMTLLKRYRTLIYAELRRYVGDPKHIWTYYATPFQSKARAIYGLNLVIIPYGVVDWSLVNDELSFDYLLLATLGNLVAHQIAHHFDANGIHYWDQIRNIQDSLMYENEFTDTNFDDYINCQKENLYQGPMNMTLPFTDQTVSFTIPRLTLNERLSEIMGLRLAYDTLALTRSNTEKRLPWIKLRIDQLFYLAYAQMYCTKSSLTSSYISLYESEDLPSRIRVFVSASNNKLLAEAWRCPIGSQIAPNDICSVFPYIDFKETVVAPE